MNAPTIRVSLGFGSLTDNTLITFARSVHTQLYGSDAFTDIPVTALALETAIDAFALAKAAQVNGGKAATAEKNNRRITLVALLKQLAYFVQVSISNDLAMLLSSGFEAVSLNRAQYPVPQPSIRRIANGLTGQALVTLTSVKVSRGSEVRVAEIGEDGAPGTFRMPVYSTSSRNVVVPDLVPGKLYAFQGRTLGGSTMHSDWSDLIVQRAA